MNRITHPQVILYGCEAANILMNQEDKTNDQTGKYFIFFNLFLEMVYKMWTLGELSNYLSRNSIKKTD